MVKPRNLEEALRPTGGWNPFYKIGKAYRIRCGNCGCLMAIAPKDMQGEYEHKCPVCGQTHVFNRKPKRWGGRHNLSEAQRMLLR